MLRKKSMNALEMLRLVEQTCAGNFKTAEVYVAKLLDDGIHEAIQLGRPWVTIHVPLWCSNALRKEADNRGFSFREEPYTLNFQIREITMAVKPEVTAQHHAELDGKV